MKIVSLRPICPKTSQGHIARRKTSEKKTLLSKCHVSGRGWRAGCAARWEYYRALLCRFGCSAMLTAAGFDGGVFG
eukprot:COSAG02_NODE_44883_length_362_cov_0.775665_1_plen_75_part_10